MAHYRVGGGIYNSATNLISCGLTQTFLSLLTQLLCHSIKKKKILTEIKMHAKDPDKIKGNNFLEKSVNI